MLVNFNNFIIELNKKILIKSQYLGNNKVIRIYLTRYINFFNLKRSYKLYNLSHLNQYCYYYKFF